MVAKGLSKMATLDRQVSQRKKIVGITERLDLLEEAVEQLQAQVDQNKKGTHQLAIAVNSSLNQLGGMNGESREMLDAVIQAVGVDVVQGIIEQNRLQAMKDAVEKTKENIAKALTEGKLVKTTVIAPKTLIVGRETKEDGSEIPPGMAFVQIEQVKEDFRAKLLGQGIGFKMETETKGLFEVLDLYQPVEPVVPPAPAAVPEAAPEAVPEAKPEPVPEAAAAPAPAPAEG